MTFAEIVGQEAAVEVLRRALGSERLPSALLFQGPEGVGKATAARALAAALLCEGGGTEGCGTCPSCLRLAHRSHPDSFLIERLPKKRARAGSDELSAFIVVDQIRELAEHAAYAPREGRARVFVIDPADRMNAEAQNALLKTLEEPPPWTTIVLVASRPHLLLPTVRSRCLAVRFPPMEIAALAAVLETRGLSGEEARARAALGEGCPGRAISLDVDALRDRRDEVLDALHDLDGPRAAGLVPSLAAKIFGKEDETLRDGLDLVEALLRDAIRADAGGGVLHADRAESLARLGARIGSTRAADLVVSIERLRRDLRFNLNRTLVAEAILAAVAGGPIPS